MIRNIVRFVVILTLICVASGGGVAITYALFKDPIAGREKNEKKQAIVEVTPEGATVDADKPLAGQPFAPDAVYAARDASGKVVAYAAAGEAQGYASMVRVMASVTPEDLSILRVAVVSQAETPGLGTQVAESKSTYTLWEKLFGPSEPDKTERQINQFLERFPGRKAEQLKDVQAITAATISSNATKRATEQAIERIRKAQENRP